jgi:predicted NBD/HSP70 family sugar kinase
MVVVPSRMGRMNQRELVSRLQTMGTASRVALAKSLGLSQPTAGKIVDQLLKEGIVEEIDIASEPCAAKAGRPPQMLRLDRRHRRFLAIQLGVTDTRLAALPVGVDEEDHWDLQFPTPASARAWRAGLAKAARRIPRTKLWGVLVSIPGVVDEQGGRVLFSPNLHWTEGDKLPSLIGRVWDAPVVLVQEERALALGHQVVKPGAPGFLLVDFGAGVGSALVVKGLLQTNPLPISGELGHTPVFGNWRRCGCGAQGCLETLVSRRGLLQSLAEHSKTKQPEWSALVQHILQRGVEPWLARTLDQTGIVIAGALNMVGLQQVILSGALLELAPEVFHHLARAITRGTMWGRFGKVDVQPAPRRRIAGLIAIGLDRLALPTSRAPEQPGHELAFAPNQQSSPAKS